LAVSLMEAVMSCMELLRSGLNVQSLD